MQTSGKGLSNLRASLRDSTFYSPKIAGWILKYISPAALSVPYWIGLSTHRSRPTYDIVNVKIGEMLIIKSV